MHIEWFSYFFGAIVVLVIPMMTVIVWFSTYRATRYQRLDAWQFVTLFSALALAVYTYFFVRPHGDMWFVAETPLWVSSGAGVALSVLLHAAKSRVAKKQRLLQERLVQAVLSQ